MKDALVHLGEGISSAGEKIGSFNGHSGGHFSGTLILLLLFSLGFIILIAYIFVYKPRKPAETEGFISEAVAVGAKLTDCTSNVPELAGIVQQINGKDNDDVREFLVLVGKLGCLKNDLVSTADRISASTNQPFVSTHDRQPITETLTQCFSKSMPPRDLELVFDLYMTRGVELIKRFGEFGVDCVSAEGAYRGVVNGIYDVAKGRCFENPAAKKLIEVAGISQGDFAAYELGGASL